MLEPIGPNSRVPALLLWASKSSSLATPAYGQQVMLRTEFPQVSRVVAPTSARSCIARGASCSFTEWNWVAKTMNLLAFYILERNYLTNI